MDFNNLFFPAPKQVRASIIDDLIYIPKKNGNHTLHIPCLYLKYSEISKILVYFHGNAEDIANAEGLLRKISGMFHLNVFAMEYPGYGLYQSETPNCDIISENSQLAYDFLTQTLGYQSFDILLMGRSMGSGPATQLASLNSDVAGLILLSPFTSLKDAVRSLLGKFPSLLVRDRFINRQAIQLVKSPVLIIHGESDSLIPVTHAHELYARCQISQFSRLVTPNLMTHNDFHDIHADLMMPIRDFLVDNEINPSLASCTRKANLEFLFQKVPEEIQNLLYKSESQKKLKYLPQFTTHTNSNKQQAKFDVSRLQKSPRKLKQSIDDTVLLESHQSSISSEQCLTTYLESEDCDVTIDTQQSYQKPNQQSLVNSKKHFQQKQTGQTSQQILQKVLSEVRNQCVQQLNQPIRQGKRAVIEPVQSKK